MSAEWLVTRDGKTKHGPYSMSKLKELADFGKLSPTDMLLSSGSDRWVRADTVSGLFGVNPISTEQAQMCLPMAQPLEPTEAPSSQMMHQQRLLVLVAAAAGMLATFLPWIHAPMVGAITGAAGDGWITLVLFLVVIMAALHGAQKQPLSRLARLAAAIPATVAAMIGVLKIMQLNQVLSDVPRDNPLSGLYLLIAAGGMVVLFALGPSPARTAGANPTQTAV